MKAYFEGKKHLFEGLYISQVEQDWTFYPVVHIDYSLVEYKIDVETFRRTLLAHLCLIAEDHDIQLDEADIPTSFIQLVKALEEKCQQKVVVLVDEYDKPMVDTLTNEEKFRENREVLRSLYTNFKDLDASLRFVFLTGVSRFSKVSIFSGLNNLEDLSNSDEFSTVVGFTQEEIEGYFSPYFKAIEEKLNIDTPRVLQLMKVWYNGFSFDGVLELQDKIYIIEFKFAPTGRVKRIETLSRNAIKQIHAKRYYEAYTNANKHILLLGLGFLDKKLHGRLEELSPMA
ncbi:MAG: AAA family ATPase [Bacteroidota bacterium]